MGNNCFTLTLLLTLASLLIVASAEEDAGGQQSKLGASETQQTSWARLQISPDTLASLKYANFRVNIYEHSDNKRNSTTRREKKYYYAPVAILDHKSATSSYNTVLEQAEMRFRIEMWNEDVESSVIRYLSTVVGEEVAPYQVQVMPLEKVILVTTSPTSTYSVSNTWLPYQQQEYLWFTLSCIDNIKCEELAQGMRTSPEEFHHFRLLFSMSSQTTQTKETVIRIESVVNGNMVSSLLQKYEGEEEVLLTAKDEKKLMSETMNNILVESFDDSDVISPSSESHIYNMLQELLIASRTTIQNQSSTMWDSVFWNDDNYRPDKTSKQLTDTYKKLDKTSQSRMVDYFNNGTKVGVELEFGMGKIFGGSLGVNYGENKEGINSKEQMEKALAEVRDNVRWDGQKFVPKPLSLCRINLAKLRDSQSLKDKNVRIRYTTAVLSTPINILDNSSLSRIEAGERKRVADMQYALEEKFDVLKKKITSIIPPDFVMPTTVSTIRPTRMITTTPSMATSTSNGATTPSISTTIEAMATTTEVMETTNVKMATSSSDTMSKINRALETTNVAVDTGNRISESVNRARATTTKANTETTTPAPATTSEATTNRPTATTQATSTTIQAKTTTIEPAATNQAATTSKPTATTSSKPTKANRTATTTKPITTNRAATTTSKPTATTRAATTTNKPTKANRAPTTTSKPTPTTRDTKTTSKPNAATTRPITPTTIQAKTTTTKPTTTARPTTSKPTATTRSTMTTSRPTTTPRATTSKPTTTTRSTSTKATTTSSRTTIKPTKMSPTSIPTTAPRTKTTRIPSTIKPVNVSTTTALPKTKAATTEKPAPTTTKPKTGRH